MISRVNDVSGAHQVEYFALHDEVVQAVHDFRDGRLPVPPMEVKDIDIVRSEVLETVCNAEVHGFGVVAEVGGFVGDGVIAARVVGRELDVFNDMKICDETRSSKS